MKKISVSLFLSCTLLSCITTRYADLQGSYQPAPVVMVSSKDQSVSAVKAWVRDNGYVLSTSEVNPDKVVFTIPQSSWTWEKEGKPELDTSLLVIRRYRDVGGNRYIKPSQVNSTWQVEFVGNNAAVKLVSAEAIYKAPQYAVDAKPGYSTGVIERRLMNALK